MPAQATQGRLALITPTRPSATNRYVKATGRNPIEALSTELSHVWGEANSPRPDRVAVVAASWAKILRDVDTEPKNGTIEPKMGADSVDYIGPALFSRGRRELLTLLFSNAEKSFYLRQIVRELGIGQGVVQRELSRLSDAGLITRTRIGSQVHYQANHESPVFTELKSLMVKTTGLAEVLREGLSTVADQIDVAFVFGSFARSEGRARSDVDVMVVGKVSFGEAVSALQPAQKRIGREVNPAVFSAEEYRARRKSKDRFVQTVLNSPKLFLIGGEHELKRLG